MPNFPKNSSLNFYQGDRLLPLEAKWQGKIDLIISNPPYIKSKQDREFVHPSVLKYEPHQALFLEDEAYFQWFMDFFEQAKLFLKKKQEGLFLMEGHEKFDGPATPYGTFRYSVKEKFHH
jgi:release factor glutamine methyltransferase